MKRNSPITLKVMEMTAEADRVASFSNGKWPFATGTLAPQKMAEAGFFYCGSLSAGWDCVKCFVCLKPLHGWEPDDNPWDEHKSHSPKCLLSKLGKKQSQMTVYEVYDIMAAHCITVQEELAKHRKQELEEKSKQVEEMIVAKEKAK